MRRCISSTSVGTKRFAEKCLFCSLFSMFMSAETSRVGTPEVRADFEGWGPGVLPPPRHAGQGSICAFAFFYRRDVVKMGNSDSPCVGLARHGVPETKW
jgi:hypothetical protein